MNNTLHTPAPWHVSPYGNVTDKSGLKIAGIEQMPGNFESEKRANANLISSAPDLLEALRFLLADYIAIEGERLTGSDAPLKTALSAISKAEGRAK